MHVGIDGASPIHTLNRAEALASDIFATAGVRLRWRLGEASEGSIEAACGLLHDPAVIININFTMSEHRPAKSSRALAYSYPYATPRPRITVNYDRLPPAFRESPRLSGIVLAYMLVHEIAHVLQRVDRHSETGVMKAYWTRQDYADMERRALTFAMEDILLIRLGLDSWTSQACPQPAEAASSGISSTKN